MRRKTTRRIAKLPSGVTEARGSGRIRRIVHASGAATKAYHAHQLPDTAGAIAAPAGCGMGADGRKEHGGGKEISALYRLSREKRSALSFSYLLSDFCFGMAVRCRRRKKNAFERNRFPRGDAYDIEKDGGETSLFFDFFIGRARNFSLYAVAAQCKVRKVVEETSRKYGAFELRKAGNTGTDYSGGWMVLQIRERISAIYHFVRDEVLFGYHRDDAISADEVLKDRYGQCNTKTILFMALLGGAGIACRPHGFTIDKKLQKGAQTEREITFCRLRKAYIIGRSSSRENGGTRSLGQSLFQRDTKALGRIYGRLLRLRNHAWRAVSVRRLPLKKRLFLYIERQSRNCNVKRIGNKTER